MKKIYFAIMTVVAMMFANCSNDDAVLENQETKLTYKFNVEGTPSIGGETRAIKSAWKEGDCIFVVFNQDDGDGGLLKSKKYMKLTYDGSKWNTSLEGVYNKLTDAEVKAYAESGKTVCACYIEGVTELQSYPSNDQLVWGYDALYGDAGDYIDDSGAHNYLPKRVWPLVVQTPSNGSNMAKLTVSDGVVSGNLKLSNFCVSQIAVTGLKSGENWFLQSSEASLVTFSKFNGANIAAASGFTKGKKSEDTTEATNGQFDFFVNDNVNRYGNIQLMNLDTKVLYTKPISMTTASTGKAYKIAGPTDLTKTSGDVGNGWTAKYVSENVTVNP